MGQTELETFREELQEASNNPYKMILGQKKLPWSLLTEAKGTKRPDLVRVEPFEATFGAKATRKRHDCTRRNGAHHVTDVRFSQAEVGRF